MRQARLLLLSTTLFAVGITEAAEAEKPAGLLPEGPRIRFADTNYDFGRVIAGDQAKHEFFFTNSGSQPLLILEIKSICGCTTAMGLGKVEAGLEGRIPVEFFSSGMDGAFDKPVLVSCNDPEQPQVALHVKGTVWRPIVVTPASAAFSTALESAAGLTRVLRITNQEQESLVLSTPRVNRGEFSAKLKTLEDGREYELAVSLVPPLGSGNVFGEVQMDTSLKTMPLLKIPVWAISQGGVFVFPRKLELPEIPLTRSEIRTVTIRNNLAGSLELGALVVSTPGVEIQVAEEQRGQSFSVVVGFPEGYALPAGGAELKIPCNQLGSPEIRVPIVIGSGAR